jgi:putative oxidoreductase
LSKTTIFIFLNIIMIFYFLTASSQKLLCYNICMILNTFPNLLTFGVLSALILRVVLGFIVIDLGYLKLSKEKSRWQNLFELIYFNPSKYFVKIVALVEIIGGLMLLVGAYTQIVAMVFAVAFLCEAILEYREDSLEVRNLPFYVLMFAISLSLIFSGAGAFALDSML